MVSSQLARKDLPTAVVGYDPNGNPIRDVDVLDLGSLPQTRQTRRLRAKLRQMRQTDVLAALADVLARPGCIRSSHRRIMRRLRLHPRPPIWVRWFWRLHGHQDGLPLWLLMQPRRLASYRDLVVLREDGSVENIRRLVASPAYTIDADAVEAFLLGTRRLPDEVWGRLNLVIQQLRKTDHLVQPTTPLTELLAHHDLWILLDVAARLQNAAASGEIAELYLDGTPGVDNKTLQRVQEHGWFTKAQVADLMARRKAMDAAERAAAKGRALSAAPPLAITAEPANAAADATTPPPIVPGLPVERDGKFHTRELERVTGEWSVEHDAGHARVPAGQR